MVCQYLEWELAGIFAPLLSTAPFMMFGLVVLLFVTVYMCLLFDVFPL